MIITVMLKDKIIVFHHLLTRSMLYLLYLLLIVLLAFSLYYDCNKLQVLKLEKRLDENLTYLRDAPLEHSTFPFDMEPTPHPKGAPIPINPIKVRTYCV